MNNSTDILLQDYLNWLKKNYKINHLEESDQIVTPFTNYLNDNINIYVDKLDDSTFLLSDDGETINDLSLNGIDMTDTRTKMLNRILLGSGILLENDELIVKGNNSQFAEKKHSLIQTILRVNDLMLTKRNNVMNLFSEEVTTYLQSRDIHGLSNAKFAGISGLDYKIDYTIPAKKDKPEIFIQFFNHLNFNEVATSAFVFEDIMEQRKIELMGNKFDPKIIANSGDYEISSRVYKAAEAKGIEVIPFSEKERIVASLT